MSSLWKSGLNQGLEPRLHEMNRSITFDLRLWEQDITGSLAHTEMLEKVGLLRGDNAQKIRQGLQSIKADLEKGTLSPAMSDEDVHGFVERVLVEKVGPEGSNIHIARSRNEQVLLDVLLYLRTTVEKQLGEFRHVLSALSQKASQSENCWMPSYTHMRRAQPIYIRQYWMAHHALYSRAIQGFESLLQQINSSCPMGAGAINGTTLPVDPEFEAEILGFESASENSLATLSSRACLLDYSAKAVHWLLDVSRLMEDLINWSTSEFGFVTFSSHVTTGSSMMPQKRNPDICELIRGKASIAMGQYVGLMSLIKGLPMGYMKDLQEDKPALFAIVDIVDEVLIALPLLLDGLQMNFETTMNAAQDPQLLATDLMEWLVLGGTPLRTAHTAVANCVHMSIETGRSFSQCARETWPDIPENFFDPEKSCRIREKPPQ